MLTLFIILMILAVFFMALTGVAVILIDPIIAVLIVIGVCKLLRKFIFKKK